MSYKQIVRRLVDSSGVSMRQLSDRMGRSPNYVYNLANEQGGLELSTFQSLADACGYDLILRPRGDGDPIPVTSD